MPLPGIAGIMAGVAGSGGGTPASPYGSHAYWMLEIDTNNGHASLTGFSGLTFYDVHNNIIPTTGGAALSAGSGTDSAPVSNLFDGNSVTSWVRSSTTNTKCGYHFTSAVAVAKIDLVTTTDPAAAPKTCRLRYSDDGVTYTTAFEMWEPSWAATGSSTRTWPQLKIGGRYKALRLYITANNGDRFCRIYESEMRATVGGADQTSGGCAIQSNSTTPNAAAGAFDGNTSLSWDIDTNSHAFPQWVGYAFPDTVLVAQYTLTQSDSNARGAKDFKLQGSNDGVAWTDLNTQTNQTWTVPETKAYTV